MKYRVSFFVVVFFTCHQLQAQNFDVNLLRKINAKNMSSQSYWMHTSNSVYYAAPTFTAGNLAYGLLYKDKAALKNGFESALSVGICLAVSGGIKSLVNRNRPTQSYPGDIVSYSDSKGKSVPFRSYHTGICHRNHSGAGI